MVRAFSAVGWHTWRQRCAREQAKAVIAARKLPAQEACDGANFRSLRDRTSIPRRATGPSSGLRDRDGARPSRAAQAGLSVLLATMSHTAVDRVARGSPATRPRFDLPPL